MVHFAQISDIHISAEGNHYDVMGEHAAGFLQRIVGQINQMETLDFVLISGDLVDNATQVEFDEFREIIQTLDKPYYCIPGNHDRRLADQTEGWTRHDFARHFNPQYLNRPQASNQQAAYWSLPATDNVQLIGLSSVVDEDWNGVIDESQLSWLDVELDHHTDKCVILTVHHPLHKLSPIDDIPRWSNFVCDNGAEVLAVLNRHPQVKLVLTGHHHLTKADQMNGRLHLACPAVGLYPCAYRTLRMIDQGNGTWQIQWNTHSATNEAMIATARQQTFSVWTEIVGFEPEFVEDKLNRALGSEWDRTGEVAL